jgi:hypothetical protein
MKTFRMWAPLTLITSVSLFLELALIRWVSGDVQIFSYLKNMPLLAAFLGLSIGFAMVGKGRDYSSSFAPILSILTLLVISFRIATYQHGTIFPGDEEMVWEAIELSYWLELFLFLAIILIFFILLTFVFVPLGQATGNEMALHKPIPAYIVNILASLLGIWAFTFLSYLETSPLVWFLLAFIGISSYMYYRKILKPISVVLFCVILIALAIYGRDVYWSRYNRITISKVETPVEGLDMGYSLNIQQLFYQNAANYSDAFIAKLKEKDPEFSTVVEDIRDAYALPFQLIPAGENVLIVGSGMGNDIAAALRNDAASVDAVEIDPRIQQFGEELHPEHPYQDARVHVIIDDARSYFNRNTTKYEAIIFGLLDSHALLSTMSSVRLDSFVYTIESFEQVRQHLKEDGIVALTFAVNKDHWVAERLGRMLSQVNPDKQVYFSDNQLGGTFIVGNLTPEQVSQANLITWQPNPEYDDLPLPTDDWPYLYMHWRKIPAVYWQGVVIGIIS